MPFNKPGEDVAKSAVLNVQNATTKIKELIIESVSTGRNKEQTFEDVKKIIAKCIKNIESIKEKEKTMNALWSLAQKHYYDFSKAIAILSTNAYNKAVFNKLINAPYNYNADGDIKTVIDKFRNKLDAEHKNIAPIIEDYQKKVRSLIRTMSAEPPRIVEYTNRNGKRISYTMSLRNRAEMKVRYEANMEELNNYIADGINLVWISTHPNCSPRCKDYQGKLYSLKNERGTINGIRYEPIDIALRGPLGDGNGCISGYNCRHRLVPYDAKSRPPNDFTEAEIQREYEIDKKQRNFENNIRQLKVNEKMLRANGDTEAAKNLRKKWRILTKEYEIYCLENKRPISLWRCVVSDEEKEYYDTNLIEAERVKRYEIAKEMANDYVIKGNNNFKNSILLGMYDNKNISLTKERRKHIYERHDNVSPKDIENIISYVNNADIVMIDDGKLSNGEPRKDSFNLIKKVDDMYLFISVKMSKDLSKDNTIITARKMSEKHLNKLINKKYDKIIDKNKTSV